MPKTKIYISDIRQVKTGIHNNKQWVLSHVIDQSGARYATFDGKKYEGMKGSEVEIEFEEKESDKINEKTGKPYVNRSIIEPKKKAFDVDAVWTELRAIKERLDKLEATPSLRDTSKQLEEKLDIGIDEQIPF